MSVPRGWHKISIFKKIEISFPYKNVYRMSIKCSMKILPYIKSQLCFQKIYIYTLTMLIPSLGNAHVEVWLNVYVNETVQRYQECKVNEISSLWVTYEL